MTSRDTVLSIDCGGTHTDAVCVQAGRVTASAKVPTRHDNLPLCIEEVLAAMEAKLGAGALACVQRITLGTTLLVNAAVQGRLDPVGLLVSAGPGLHPSRFTLGEYVSIVPGGLDHRGVEVQPLELDVLERDVVRMREAGISAFACVGKFSPRNPAHEERMAKEVARLVPDAFITLGHRLGGELNFPRRLATAYYNSAAHRLHKAFADAVSSVLASRGCTADIYLLKADGGALPLTKARLSPVQSMLSGPAASVMGALALDRHLAEKPTLLLDMGGTTTDLALFVAGSPVLDRDGMRVEGRRTLIRSLATRSIGVGGDSLLHIEAGPHGPVLETGPVREGRALAFGGEKATLLDALNVLNAPEVLNVPDVPAAPAAEERTEMQSEAQTGAHAAAQGDDESGTQQEACGTQTDQCAGDVAASQRGLEALGRHLGLSARAAAAMAVDNALSKIAAAIAALVADINAKPVYTLKELKEYSDVVPERICLVGGPAACVHKRLQQALGLEVVLLPMADVANATGAALTRPSALLQVFAHTGKRQLLVPELDVTEPLPAHASLPYVEERALAILKDMLTRSGIMNSPMQVTHSELFAVLNDNGSSAKDMRVTVQVVPGLATRLIL